MKVYISGYYTILNEDTNSTEVVYLDKADLDNVDSIDQPPRPGWVTPYIDYGSAIIFDVEFSKNVSGTISYNMEGLNEPWINTLNNESSNRLEIEGLTVSNSYDIDITFVNNDGGVVQKHYEFAVAKPIAPDISGEIEY